MRGSWRLVAFCALLAMPANGWAGDRARPKRTRITCPADLAAAVAAQCPCDGARSHGQYVSCLARYRNSLRRSGCLDDTGRTMVRCAGRSTCGRPEAVVCCTTAPFVAHDAAACVAQGGVSQGPGSVCMVCPVGDPPPTTTTTSTTITTTSTTSTTTDTTTTSTTSSSTTTVPSGVTYGNATEFPGASAHSPDFLLGVPVVVPQSSMLTHLCVIAKSGGPDVVLALYSDAGGWPDTLVADTSATPMTVGTMELPVTPTAVAPGTYWIMGVYSADASIGVDESDPSAPDRYTDDPFGSPLPDPFGPATAYSGQRFNYYVRVE